MCKFLSAIVTRGGDVLAAPEYTDSHETLLTHLRQQGLQLDDSADLRNFVPIEFSAPIGVRPDNVGGYVRRLSIPYKPIWFDDMRYRVRAKCMDMVSRMIIRDSRKLLLGGCWIVCGKARIERAHNCRIISIGESAFIKCVSGTTEIGSVNDSSKIEYVCDSVTIGEVSDSARIGCVTDYVLISRLTGMARIESARGSTVVDFASDKSTIGQIEDHARIECDSRFKTLSSYDPKGPETGYKMTIAEMVIKWGRDTVHRAIVDATGAQSTALGYNDGRVYFYAICAGPNRWLEGKELEECRARVQGMLEGPDAWKWTWRTKELPLAVMPD